MASERIAIADGEALAEIAPASGGSIARFRWGRGDATIDWLRPARDPHFEHGHGWRAGWRVAERDAARVALEFAHEPDAWPWRYAARQEISLAETSMPLGFGLHPWFPRTPGCRLSAGVASMRETDAEMLPTALAAPRWRSPPTRRSTSSSSTRPPARTISAPSRSAPRPTPSTSPPPGAPTPGWSRWRPAHASKSAPASRQPGGDRP